MPCMKRRSYQRWDGDSKYKTKNCTECNFKIDFYDKEICSWGVTFKYLVERKKGLRKCEYFGKEPPKDNSLEYVMYAKKNNLFGRAKGIKYVKQLKLAF